MRRDKADELPHQLVGEVHRLSALVKRSALIHIPLLEQLHHAVIPADMRLDNLTAARVYNARTVGILRLRGQIAHHRVAGIVETHRRVVGPVLGNDSVLKAGSLESHIPVFDTHLQILRPLLRSSRVDIEYNLLLGFHQFAGLVSLRILGFQPVARDNGVALGNIVVAIAHHPAVEESHALVSQSRTHRFLGQQYHAGCQHHGSGACLRGWRLSRRHRIGAQRVYLHIDGVRLDGINHRTVVLHGTYAKNGAVAVVEAGHLIVGHQPLGDVDQASLRIRIAPDDVELIDDGVSSRLLQRLADSVFLLGKGRLHVLSEEERLLTVLLEIDGRAVHLFAAQHLEPLRHALEARHRQYHTVQQRVGHFEIPVVLDMTHGKESITLRAALLHHFVVGILVVLNGGVGTTLHLCLRLRFGGHRVICYDSKSRLLTHDE